MNFLQINSTRTLKFLVIIITFASTNAHSAFNNSRAEKWEFFLAPQFTNSKLLQFDNGAEADINERSTLGFGLGYNLNRHIELAVLFAAGNSSYSGKRIIDDGSNTPEKFTSNLYTSTINFDFTYNILSTPFTPFVSANIGTTFIDTGIPTGNITTGCWWDPWWGYVCSPRAQTHTSTEVNYGAGIGLRYDFSRKVYIKGGVGKNFIDLNTDNTPDFTSYRFTFGLMF